MSNLKPESLTNSFRENEFYVKWGRNILLHIFFYSSQAIQKGGKIERYNGIEQADSSVGGLSLDPPSRKSIRLILAN